jgi:glutathione synthase/RimK-type ligase-like ATP-grasp enzyme
LGLGFAAIDLIEDAVGNFWFLEANPNGQYVWLEEMFGIPISGSVAEALLALEATA